VTVARLKRLADSIIRFGLQYPGAYEDSPWDHRALKVQKKLFVIMSGEVDRKTGFTLTVKLPHSGESALSFPFAEPCRYGMGKYGWVTIRISPGDQTPKELFQEWIDESYRAIAPKKLVAQLDEVGD